MSRPIRLLCLVVPLFLAACAGPADPLDETINAKSAMSFLAWQTRHEASHGAEAKREFDAALQELRFELSGRFRLLNSAQVDEALRAATHGHTLRSVLVRAWRHKHARLDDERRLLRGVVRLNVGGEPVNLETARKLEATLDRQIRRLDQLEEELTRLEKRLAELGSPVAEDPAASPLAPSAPPPPAAPLASAGRSAA